MPDTTSDTELLHAGDIVTQALANPMKCPLVRSFFDPATFTISHVVRDPSSHACAIIDSVLDYDPASGRTMNTSAQDLINYIKSESLEVQWLLETHAHADHLSAAPLLQAELGGQLAIGREIIRVQEVFGKIFNAGTEFQRDGSQFDHLFLDGDRFKIGNLDATRPACTWPHTGLPGLCRRRRCLSGRHALHAGLRHGAMRLSRRRCPHPVSLDQETDPAARSGTDVSVPRLQGAGPRRLRLGNHGRAERTSNVHVHDGVTEDEFVTMRNARDATLGMPRLILPSVQVNMRAGQLPPADDNGIQYLKIPVNAL
ncbi:MBL fold metallo-hydrolase [Bacillus sp. PR5]|nr:MBL fold metallo-hydrolase [Bacillus sp. PR5]